MMLLAEQTQFPVGQGGLHLTQLRLRDDTEEWQGSNRPFSLVYDCGGHGSPLALNRRIKDVRGELEGHTPDAAQHLDVLVLSHLHSDHINGFKRLVAGPPLTIGTLIIPHYDDEHQLILLAQVAASTGDMNAVQEVNNAVRDPGTWFGERGVASVIAVRPGDEDTPTFEPGPEGLPPGFEPISRTERPRETETTGLDAVIGAKGGVDRLGRMAVVSPGAHLAIQRTGGHGTGITDWAFVPYCKRWTPGGTGATSQHAFVQAVRACLAPYRQQDGRLLIGSSDADNVRDCLTAAFLNYLGRKVADATWNVLSLSLFGGPLRQRTWRRWHPISWRDGLFLDADLRHRDWYDMLDWLGRASDLLAWHRRQHRSHWHAPRSPTAACGWMLTGDSDLTGGAPDWNRFYRVLLPQVGCFQLPHHGSVHNSDASLPLGSTTLPFVTCRRGDNKHPHPHVEAFLAKQGLHLAHVTTDPDSAIRSIVLLKV